MVKAKLEIVICLGLALVTVALFWPVHNHGFVSFDDLSTLTENPHVRTGLSFENIKWAFSDRPIGFWRPLAQLALMVDCEFFGLKAGAHHLVSLLVHLTNTLLLFWVLKQMTGARWRSAFVAALFAWHPLHVESVAWVVELEDLLNGLFWMLTFWAYVKHVTSGKWQVSRMESAAAVRGGILLSPVSCHLSRYYWLALLFFALGLMSKPTIVTLPFVLLLLDYWPLQRFPSRFTIHDSRFTQSASRLLWEKLPFLGLTVASCVVTFYTEQKGGTTPTLAQNSFGLRFANAVTSYAAYLRKTVWPDDLAVFYPYPSSVSLLHVTTAILLLVVISFGVVAVHRMRSYLAVGWFWFLGTLVPVIGLVSARPSCMADRYTYIPLIGVFVIVSWGVADLTGRWSCRKAVVVPAMVMLLTACVWSARVQLAHWRNSLSLFTQAAIVSPDSAWVHLKLGNALDAAGRPEAAKAQFDKALELKPGDVATHNNYGVVLAKEGKLDEAAAHFSLALQTNPFHAEAHCNLGNILLRRGELSAALNHFAAALRSKPDHEAAHEGLGRALARQGNLDGAIEHFTAALRGKPESPELQKLLARALAEQGRLRESSAHYAAACLLNPHDAEAHNGLGVILVKQGKIEEAIVHFNRALAEGTDLADTHGNLGNAFMHQGKIPEAIAHFREALRLKSDWVEVLNNLAWILATQQDAQFRNGAEAVRLAEHAAELTKNAHPQTLDTLAAAYAEAGRFPDAVQAARRALTLAEADGQRELAAQVRTRLSDYESGKPYRE